MEKRKSLGMTEHDIQNAIRLALSEMGFAVFRINVGKVQMKDGRWFDCGTPKGWSDLTAIKDGKVYFLEVKTSTGAVRDDQKHFLATMRNRYKCKAGIVRSVEDAIKLCQEEK